MSPAMDFQVRNLQGVTGLDGAFRVHIPPDAIQQAGLVFNETCDIAGEDGRAIGCGIVWRAGDKLGSTPKTKPVRLSETMRDAFGIKDGSVVKLSPHGAGIVQADKMVLTDVTLEPQPAEDNRESRRWRGRCTVALYNAEAIAIGTTFDVQAKKGLRRRFAVENIVSSQAAAGVPHLYYVTDETQLEFEHEIDSPLQSPGLVRSSNVRGGLSIDGIGGLLEQIEALNRSIRLLLQQTGSATYARPNHHVILHGYEGTGKTLLLGRMAKLGLRKNLRLEASKLDGPVAAKKKIITDTFAEARAHQPSVVLMDDLHKLASPESPLIPCLCQELDSISGSQVLVVAATRSLHEIHPDLLGPERLIKEVELPIPDQQARQAVLTALLLRTDDDDEAFASKQGAAIASRTHGFTSRDLAKLVAIARMFALERTHVESPPPLVNGPEPNGDSHREHGAPDLRPSDADWTAAFSRVRPAALREILFTTPNISWSDIGGSAPIRAHLDRVIGWPLKHADLMKKHRLPAKKGMLLYGPPGCSKTLTAQAVAATYSMNFIVVKGAELISMYVGESERSVREIFRKARAARPCIIFFDEIDSIASEREGGGGKGLNVLTTLLNEMDGFESLTGVFVLAATNKPQALDPAIMRPGRFDQHLYLGPPDAEARKEILAMQLSSAGGTATRDLTHLIEETDGYTGAELVAVCNLAKEGAFERLLFHGSGRGTDAGGVDKSAGEFEVKAEDMERALREIVPRVTKEVLASYETFGKRG